MTDALGQRLGASPTSPSGSGTYTVRAGDTLGTIARSMLGSTSRWGDIAALNQDILPYPSGLREGMVLRLPSSAAPARPHPAPPSPRGLFWEDRFEGRVALTFDDGPHPEHTPRVLDALARGGARATFFVCGRNARQCPELIRRMVSEGHTLGNHSDTHAHLSRLAPAEVVRELRNAQAAVDAALGYHYELHQVRPPFGALGAEVKEVIHSLGHALVMWNVDSLDGRCQDDERRILDNVFSGACGIHARGGVILFHDTHPQTARVLDEVLARLRREGFALVKTEALLLEKYPADRPAVS